MNSLADGGMAGTACHLMERSGGRIVCCLFLQELAELSLQARIPVPVVSLIKCWRFFHNRCFFHNG